MAGGGERRAGAGERRLEFIASIAPGITVESDGDQLAMILRNLMENAVVHSAPDTVVECSAAANPVGAELRLVNTAPDQTRADLDHVFDRLWRKDAARTDRRHLGLGLSIARALCDRLGIRLEVALREGQRFEARLVFPASSSKC